MNSVHSSLNNSYEFNINNLNWINFYNNNSKNNNNN
jgi:hypothetical protein